jgi:iron complex outermembrane recepter protein
MTEGKLAFFVPAPAHSRAWKASEIKTILKRGCLGLACAVLMAIPTWPQVSPTDLATKSLEDLMNIQVTSVSKRGQNTSQVAAAVFVITQEDIRRSGATNIPDLLRMVPGLDVAQINGSTWAISARGFNQQFSNKLLVMIDRRVVYTSTFAGVFWDVLDLPLGDIDRIEVIRGSGGTIWGANAVNGVISIFTKKASDTHGAMVEAGGGNLEQGFGTFQYGGKLKSATDYRVYAKYFNQSPMLDLNGQNGADSWSGIRGGFRMDSAVSPKDSLVLEGNLFNGQEGEFGFFLPSVTSPALIPVSEQIHSTDGSIQVEWNRVHSQQSDSSLMIAYGRFTRNDPLNPETRDTVDLDFQHHTVWGTRQDIVWGFGYRYTTDDIGGSLTVEMVPGMRQLNLFDGFVQDEIRLVGDLLYLTAGTKIERNDYTGLEIMPSIRATCLPREHDMLWGAISRSLRAPSRNDTDLLLNFGTVGTPDLQRLLGNPNFQDERLIDFEAGYRTTLARRLSLDAAVYFTDYDNLQTTEPLTPFFEPTPLPAHEVQPFMYENLMFGKTHGIELAANWKLSDRWTLSPGYAFEELHMHTDPASADTQTGPFVEGAAPRNSAQLRSHVEAYHGVAWDASVYYLDQLNHQGPLGDVTIPAYTRLDTGLTWQLRESVTLNVVGQNLLRDHHLEFIDIDGSLQSGQIKRSGYAKLAWRF